MLGDTHLDRHPDVFDVEFHLRPLATEHAADLTRDLFEWLRDRKNRRAIPHRFDACDYVPVRNPSRSDGLWIVNDKRQVVYGRRNIPLDQQVKAAKKLSEEKAKTGTEVLQEIMIDI